MRVRLGTCGRAVPLVLLLSSQLFAAGSRSENDFDPRRLYKKCSPSVVMVTVTETVPRGLAKRTLDLLNPFPLEDLPGDVLRFVLYPLVVLVNGPLKASGSGVIIDRDGHLLTNHHVVEHGNVFWATLDDRRVIRATLIGSDQDEDYALLKLELEKGDTVTPAGLGSSGALRPGDRVFAIGSPLRYRQTLTTGVVSGVERRVHGPFQDFIQTDLTIGSGSSGGPLFNAHGDVVGLTTLMYAALEPTGGVTFSVPIDAVKEGLDRLKTEGEVMRGFIGVHVRDVTPRVAEKFALKVKNGACVVELSTLANCFFSPARRAGLEPGDVIVKYGALAIDRARTLARAVLNTKPGTKVPIRFYRGKDLLERTLTVRTR